MEKIRIVKLNLKLNNMHVQIGEKRIKCASNNSHKIINRNNKSF